MEKATREAQRHTSWLTPNEAYEAATTAFVEAILDPGTSEPFLTDFVPFAWTLIHLGAFNALSQQTLKLTSPGVPDIYQGTELWDLSLVDPDNRRPVDYAARAELLATVSSLADGSGLVDDLEDGRIKLFVTHKLLDLRRQLPDLFAGGDYQPLQVVGTRADHAVAFRRQHPERNEAVIVVVPRLVAGLLGGKESAPLSTAVWADTRLCLPEADRGARFQNLFAGATTEPHEADEAGTIAVADALATFPVAVLVRAKTHVQDETA
jgi:(1->4)-alpha-D-glucan 1-alpha-D-glucosylmutase